MRARLGISHRNRLVVGIPSDVTWNAPIHGLSPKAPFMNGSHKPMRPIPLLTIRFSAYIIVYTITKMGLGGSQVPARPLRQAARLVWPR